MESTYRIFEGKRLMMDLVELDGEYEKSKIYMFVLLSWGITADIA